MVVTSKGRINLVLDIQFLLLQNCVELVTRHLLFIVLFLMILNESYIYLLLNCNTKQVQCKISHITAYYMFFRFITIEIQVATATKPYVFSIHCESPFATITPTLSHPCQSQLFPPLPRVSKKLSKFRAGKRFPFAEKSHPLIPSVFWGNGDG